MSPTPLSLAFAIALAASTLLKFWLSARQIRHVAIHRGQVPAAFAGNVSLAAHQKAADYTIARARFGLLSLAFSAAVLLGWTLLGGLDALNRAVLEASHGLPAGWQAMGYQLGLVAAFALLGGLLDLPWEMWSTFRIEQAFGFNRTTLALYFSDMLKGLAVGVLLGLPIVALILWLMGAAGPRWWLWAWGAWMGFNLLVMVIYPSVIAPLFNKFEPLTDTALRDRVERLMARCGFSAKGLFVMDGSRRSAHGNAYFSGFGPAKRVVFFDTLLAKLDGGEVEAVLAHELGHFKHRHITKRIVLMFALSLAGFALLGWLAQQPAFYLGLGVQPSLSAPNDALALILFLLAGPVFGFFVTPLASHFSRRDEFQADAYARAQASAAALSSALLKLHEDNAGTLTPDPVYARFYYSHPPAAERLAALAP
ncbi:MULTISPECIES: M48 family metallopeptidase [Roseateles]|uniref:M48 family metallopeptidase n=1 Tax=Pelomonas caseinilytica TaxID=2906763 RepID=A0ABS8XHD9_9BURK|nr:MULTISPECIES: M48 family metallopeptidase [unclassified Roseateles]MCE4540274.1 M48 family metallopeptidase [Pelomonas sp. P7]HEV6966282.1 M48 family metallopeptidase [Roseateles sp.]